MPINTITTKKNLVRNSLFAGALFLGFAIFYAGYGSNNGPADLYVGAGANSANAPVNLQRAFQDDSSSIEPKRSDGYLGCWSSTNANFMEINRFDLQTRNSYEPLKYLVVTDEVAAGRGVQLVEILEPDASNEFQKFVTFKVVSDIEMRGWNFRSREDFKENKPSGIHAKWIRTNCAQAALFLKSAPRASSVF